MVDKLSVCTACGIAHVLWTVSCQHCGHNDFYKANRIVDQEVYYNGEERYKIVLTRIPGTNHNSLTLNDNEVGRFHSYRGFNGLVENEFKFIVDNFNSLFKKRRHYSVTMSVDIGGKTYFLSEKGKAWIK